MDILIAFGVIAGFFWFCCNAAYKGGIERGEITTAREMMEKFDRAQDKKREQLERIWEPRADLAQDDNYLWNYVRWKMKESEWLTHLRAYTDENMGRSASMIDVAALLKQLIDEGYDEWENLVERQTGKIESSSFEDREREEG